MIGISLNMYSSWSLLAFRKRERETSSGLSFLRDITCDEWCEVTPNTSWAVTLICMPSDRLLSLFAPSLLLSLHTHPFFSKIGMESMTRSCYIKMDQEPASVACTSYIPMNMHDKKTARRPSALNTPLPFHMTPRYVTLSSFFFCYNSWYKCLLWFLVGGGAWKRVEFYQTGPTYQHFHTVTYGGTSA